MSAATSRSPTSWRPCSSRCCASIRRRPRAGCATASFSPRAIARRRSIRHARRPRLSGRKSAPKLHARCAALLNGHPNRKIPGVEANTGPLGHGCRSASDRAIAAKLARAAWRVFVVLGDGELQEGSNWEAAMCAAHYGLDNLTAIVDRNRLQQGARTEDTNRLEPLGGQMARLRLGDGRMRRPRSTPRFTRR